MSLTDMELVLQKNKQISMKVELLDIKQAVVSQIQGTLTQYNYTNSAESDIRRICSMTLYMPKVDETIAEIESIWSNNMVYLYYGIWDGEAGDYRWFKLGTFLVSQGGYRYDAEAQELSLSLVDKMAALTSECGNAYGTDVQVWVDSNLKNAIEATVLRNALYPGTVNVCDFPGPVPNTLEYSAGSYPYDQLSEMVALYPYHEHFYDKDGVYTVRKVPIATNEPVAISSSDMHAIIISDSGTQKRTDIHNVSEVWGKQITATCTASDCDGQTQIGQYTLTVYNGFVLEDGAMIGLTPDIICSDAQTIKILSKDSYVIYTEAGDGTLTAITAGAMKDNTHYVVRYMEEKFIFQGETDIHAICMEFNEVPSEETLALYKLEWDCENIQYVINPNSPFAVDRIGAWKAVYKDGEYANIPTTQLALERASFENWKTTRLKDSVTLKCLFVPWLEVNQKIEYTSIVSGVTRQYLVQTINTSDGQTMDLTVTRFYPYYPWLDQGGA